MSKKKFAGCKRPPNAFILFCRDTRPSITQKFPKMPSSDVSSLLSHLWRSLDVLTKQCYKQQAEKLQIVSGNKPPFSDNSSPATIPSIYSPPISSDSSPSDVEKIVISHHHETYQYYPMLKPNELFYQLVTEKDCHGFQSMFENILGENENIAHLCSLI